MASLIGHGITITELRIRLEAYTLSNRRRSLRILIIVKTTGWKPVPRSTAHCSLFTTHCFDVHLDETTPHIQIQTIPVAKTKARGRASAKYVHKDDKSKVLSHKEWKKLPEEIHSNFIRTEDERREKECVSYACVWGKDKYPEGKTYY